VQSAHVGGLDRTGDSDAPPKLLRTTVSIACALAAPLAQRAQASRSIANCRRLPMKPGISRSINAGSLPALRKASHTQAVTSGAVRGPAHTSTSGISCGGYQKCVAITRSGCRTRAISALAG
jgi:hypothetical protein